MRWLAGLRQLRDAVERRLRRSARPSFDAHGDGETLHAARSTACWLRGALRHGSGRGRRAGPGRARHSRPAEPHRWRTCVTAASPSTRSGPSSVRSGTYPIRRQARGRAAPHRPRRADRRHRRARPPGNDVRHVVDPDGTLAHAETQFDRRYLHLSPLLDGMTAVDGLLDAEAATVLASALSALPRPRGPDDHRSTAQRRADGLVDIARAAIDSDSLPELSSAAAQLQVVIPWSTITRAGPEPARLPDHPAGAGWLTPARRAASLCDASVSRVLLDADSVPLDLGRSHRLFTRHQRRALALRDDGCRFPGCPPPARYTDAHHVLAWAAGGHHGSAQRPPALPAPPPPGPRRRLAHQVDRPHAWHERHRDLPRTTRTNSSPAPRAALDRLQALGATRRRRNTQSVSARWDLTEPG